jgi:hypothetical protein
LIGEGYKICNKKNSQNYEPELNNKLVHVKGELETYNILSDSEIGVSVEKCLILERVVEIYDYVEEKQGDEYTYHKNWVPSNGLNIEEHPARESVRMKRDTKFRRVYDYMKILSNEIFLGEYKLQSSLLQNLHCQKNINLSQQTSYLKYEDIKSLTKRENVEVEDSFLKICARSNKNKIGDIRITYNVLEAPQQVTIIALQNNQSLEPFDFDSKQDNNKLIEMSDNNGQPKNELAQPLLISDASRQKGVNANDVNKSNDKGVVASIKHFMETDKRQIYWIFPGHLELEECFENRKNLESQKTWIFRLIGFLMFTFGIYFFFAPLLALLSWIPILGTIVKFLFFVFSLLVGICFTILTIALAWLFYRPLLSALLIISCVVIYFLSILIVGSEKTEINPI